jgi:ribosomal protein L21E
MKFKIGDTVKIIASTFDPYDWTRDCIGKTGEVRQLNSENKSYLVFLNDDDEWWFAEDDLRLEKDATFKVGDRVRIVKDSSSSVPGTKASVGCVGEIIGVNRHPERPYVVKVNGSTYGYGPESLELANDAAPDIINALDSLKAAQMNHNPLYAPALAASIALLENALKKGVS